MPDDTLPASQPPVCISPPTLRTLHTAPADCVQCNCVTLSSHAKHFFPHTRPPDISVCLEYEGSLVNTYSDDDDDVFYLRTLTSLDLRSIPRQRLHNIVRRALAITRRGASVDLPDVRCNMSGGSDEDAPAARDLPQGARAHHAEARESSRTWLPGDFPALSDFKKHCVCVPFIINQTPASRRNMSRPRASCN